MTCVPGNILFTWLDAVNVVGLYIYIVYYNKGLFCKLNHRLQDVFHIIKAQGGSRVHVGVKLTWLESAAMRGWEVT